MDELVINDSNFEEYFFDIRKHKPQQGQIMACFRATADFIDGYAKRDIIELLRVTNKAHAVTTLMQKLQHSTLGDSYRVPYEMAVDLLSYMAEYDGNEQIAVEKVAQKPYKFTVEIFYYAKREHIPENDPHWSVIELLNLDQHLDRVEVIEDERGTTEIKSRIVSDNPE